MGVPHFTYRHWQYGDLQIKPTDIWGYFKEPAPTVKKRQELLTAMYPNGSTHACTWGSPKAPPEYSGMGLNRAAIRAITPTGFANAFYKVNQ